MKLVSEELRKLREEKMGVKQLSSAKEQIMGQVAMAEESNISFMIMMARSILDLGRVPTLEEIFARIQETSAHEIMKMANEMFDESKMSYLMMEPV
jgi:predicted Zn-dependent peptidase